MRSAAHLLLVVLVLGAAPFAGGCITDPVTGETVIGMPMSDAEEAAEGNKYAPSFKAQYEGAYPDRELQQHLGRIVIGMAKTAHRPDLPWNFTVLNSSDVNAFALPGGTVCITRGLLWQLESEAAFAAVMGHEIGHVNHRHSVQQMGQQALIGIGVMAAGVAAEVSDSDIGMVGATLGAVGGQLLLLKFSRDDELEADLRGVEYSYAAGYDPREMASVFELFKELKQGESPPELFSTHPLDDRRIDELNREIAVRYPEVGRDGRQLVRTTRTWERLSGRLKAAQQVYDIYDDAAAEYGKAMKAGDRSRLPGILAKLQSCERRLPGHALFPSGAGVVLKAMGRKAEARAKFEQAAALQPDLFEPHLYLSEMAFESGDRRRALDHAKRAKALFPHHPAGYYFAGRVQDEAGNTREALPDYESVVQLAPEESDFYKFSARRVAEIRGSASR